MTRRTTTAVLAGLLAGLLALAGSGEARAEPSPEGPPRPAPVMPAPATARVDVELMLIHATMDPKPLDKRLAPVADALATMPFRSFELLDHHELRIADGAKQSVKLSDDRRLEVHLLSHDKAQARVRVKLETDGEKVMDSTVTIHRGKFFYLAVQNRSQGALVIPISVRY